MVTIGARRLILKPQMPMSGINYLRVLGVALSNICYTQTNCITTSDILAVRDLAGWCQNLPGTQQLWGLAIVNVGCGETPEPVFVCCRCACGSWYLQIVHTSDHCVTAICGGALRQLTSTACLGACSGCYVECTYQRG